MKKYAAAVAVVSAVSMTAACGSDDTNTSSDTTESTTSESPSEEETPQESEAPAEPMGNLVGPGCDDYAKAVPDGAGSVEGMAQDPVAVAASNNPLLKTLTAAVSGKVNPDVNLVDTLNGDEFTVFAPVDDAFAQVPKKTMTTLTKDADLLSTILTYHVIPGQIAPEELAGSTQTTVQGDKVEIKGSVDSLKVGESGASVICGGVQTANATVYLIDSVLMPPSM